MKKKRMNVEGRGIIVCKKIIKGDINIKGMC